MKEIYEVPSIEVIKFESMDSVKMEISNPNGGMDNEGGDGNWDD